MSKKRGGAGWPSPPRESPGKEFLMTVPATGQSVAGPDLYHYRKFMMALMWGCVHDRTHLVRVDGVGVARADCEPGLYRCELGHEYRRNDDRTWTRVGAILDEVA